jgi:hypothetical protein
MLEECVLLNLYTALIKERASAILCIPDEGSETQTTWLFKENLLT